MVSHYGMSKKGVFKYRHPFEYIVIDLLQEETFVSDSRPSTGQVTSHMDPLALEVDDLYIKFKVWHISHRQIIQSMIVFFELIIFCE